MLRLKAIKKCDFILCFGQELDDGECTRLFEIQWARSLNSEKS